MEMTIKIKNYAELEKAFKRAPAVAAEELNKSLERIAVKVVSEAQKRAPVGKSYSHGGNLRQSIRYTKYGTSGFVVWVNATYGVYVDQGTKPHVILPRRKKMLAFQKDGRWVFAKRVNHPGTRAQPFFTDAVAEAQTFADSELSAGLDRIISKI